MNQTTTKSDLEKYLLLCMAGIRIKPSALLADSMTPRHFYHHKIRTLYVDPLLTIGEIAEIGAPVLDSVITRTAETLPPLTPGAPAL